MVDMQSLVFEWAAKQPALTGLGILSAGLVYGLCGFRLARYLVAFPAAGIGAAVGWWLAPTLQLAWQWPTVGLAAVAAILSWAWPRASLVVCATVTWAVVGGYLAWQFGVRSQMNWVAMALVGSVGLVLTLISRQPMTVLVTTVQGAGLAVTGFVCVSSALLPSLGRTFCSMSREYGVIVPVLMSMLCVTGFSYQSAARQGDIFTGSQIKSSE